MFLQKCLYETETNRGGAHSKVAKIYKFTESAGTSTIPLPNTNSLSAVAFLTFVIFHSRYEKGARSRTQTPAFDLVFSRPLNLVRYGTVLP